jgi:hypothetical protein
MAANVVLFIYSTGEGIVNEGETNQPPLCCTDQQPGAVSPSSDILREADVLRPAKLEHAVQRGGSNGHLGRLPAPGP